MECNMTTRRKQAPRSRATLALQHTFSKSHTLLSFEGDLALKYAAIWFAAAGSPRPPASGVIRRALQVYMGHLEAADQASEARAIRSICSVAPTPDDEQQTALIRLYGCLPGERPPSFEDIRRSPAKAREMADLTARAEALAKQCLRSRPMRRASTRQPHQPTTSNSA